MLILVHLLFAKTARMIRFLVHHLIIHALYHCLVIATLRHELLQRSREERLVSRGPALAYALFTAFLPVELIGGATTPDRDATIEHLLDTIIAECIAEVTFT